jgi:hypothetical protein
MNPEQKQQYQDFCKNNTVPVFMQDWYLDAVCDEGHWDVCFSYAKDGQVRAILPYYVSTYMGLRVIKMPRLCPFMGIWIQYPEHLRAAKKIAFENKVINELVSQLPQVNYYVQHYPYQLTNCLPLKWLGFEQTTIYSYRLEDLSDLDVLFQKFEGRLRTAIRKAQGSVQIFSNDDVELFYETNRLTFERQGLKMPYSLAFIKRLDAALMQRNRRTIYFAKDEQGNIHAGLYIIYGEEVAYNLMAGGDAKFRQSGAMQWLLWQAIQDAFKRVKVFDFEGSMLENVEYAFRAFGGELKPYSVISKARNRWLGMLKYYFY